MSSVSEEHRAVIAIRLAMPLRGRWLRGRLGRPCFCELSPEARAELPDAKCGLEHNQLIPLHGPVVVRDGNGNRLDLSCLQVFVKRYDLSWHWKPGGRSDQLALSLQWTTERWVVNRGSGKWVTIYHGVEVPLHRCR